MCVFLFTAAGRVPARSHEHCSARINVGFWRRTKARRKFTLSVSLFIWADTNRLGAAFQRGRRRGLDRDGWVATRRPDRTSEPVEGRLSDGYPVCA